MYGTVFAKAEDRRWLWALGCLGVAGLAEGGAGLLVWVETGLEACVVAAGGFGEAGVVFTGLGAGAGEGAEGLGVLTAAEGRAVGGETRTDGGGPAITGMPVNKTRETIRINTPSNGLWKTL